MLFKIVFKILLQTIAVIGFLIGTMATYFSALGVYYKEPYFSMQETFLYAFIALLCLFTSFKLFKRGKREKVL